MSLRRDLIRDTMLYGFGDIFTKAIAFLLIPLYTNALLPEEYGIYQLIVLFVTVMMVLSMSGMNVALFKHFVVTNDQRKRKELFTITIVWVFFSSVVIIGLSMILSRPLSNLLTGNPGRGDLVGLAALGSSLDTALLILLLIFRMEKKPIGYISYSFAKILLILAGNFILVWHMDMGVAGILIAGIIADVIILAPLLYRVSSYFVWPISKKLLASLLFWGIPFIPASLATVILTLSDRLLLRFMEGFDSAGIYSVGYKIGGAVLLLYTAFRFAWGPYMFELAKDNAIANRIYPKVFNLLFAFLGFAALGLVTFSTEIFQLFVGELYYSARPVLIPISLAVLFDASSLFFGAAFQTRDRTIYIPVITGLAALSNILLNVILIPQYGFIGAAWATLASYIALAYMNFRVANPFMPVKYSWGRIFSILAIVSIGMVTVWFVEPVLIRLAIFLVFSVLILFCLDEKPWSRFKLNKEMSINPDSNNAGGFNTTDNG
ncbi:oligosaccharide flippase family protein [bacterium]|nr:oligosaccharide flippase family protein [bacterium]